MSKSQLQNHVQQHVDLELGKAETQNPPKERNEDADYRDKYSKTNSKEKILQLKIIPTHNKSYFHIISGRFDI